MTASISLHDLTDFEANQYGETTWLKATCEDGTCVTIFMPLAVAEEIVDAWHQATAAEEARQEAAYEAAYDPERIAARDETYRRQMIEAGRGHLLGG